MLRILYQKNICGVSVILNNHGCKQLVQYQLSLLNRSSEKYISLKMSVSIFGTGVSIYGTKRVPFLETFPKMETFLK